MPLIQGVALNDFTGGLNLEEDAFKLGLNELPDVLNMQLNKRGGLELRGGIVPLGDDTDVLSGHVSSMFGFVDSTGAARLMTTTDTAGAVRYWTGTAWSTTNLGTVNMGATIPTRAAAFKSRIYLQSGNVDPWRWNGTSNAVQLTTFAFNNNLENPTAPASNGKMPRAKLICSWMGSMWVAHTTESGTAFPNRVRWSHPNFPEDWHQDHYVDVDPGKDGDAITALVPLEDRLLVFKRSSIHMIGGAPPNGISVVALTYEIGALNQDAVVATDVGVYVYDPTEGLYLIRDKGPEWQMEKLQPAVLDGRFSNITADQVMLGWGNRRLWLSVPFDGAEDRSDVFVLDPVLASRRNGSGAWTRFRAAATAALGPFLEWNPPGATYQFLAAAYITAVGASNESEVVKLDQPVSTDLFYAFYADPPYTAFRIDSYFLTSWVDLGEPYRVKRWKRPEIVLQSGVEATFDVEGFLNYDFGTARRRFTLTAETSSNSLVWGTGLWGTNTWGASTELLNQIEHGHPLGLGRSVALRFNGPLSTARWGVDQVSFKFIPKKIRNH